MEKAPEISPVTRVELFSLIPNYLNTSTRTNSIIAKTKIQPTVSIDLFDMGFSLRRSSPISVPSFCDSADPIVNSFSASALAGKTAENHAGLDSKVFL